MGDFEATRDRATIKEHHIENTAYTKYPGNFYGYLDEWNEKEFEDKFKVNIIEYTKGKNLEVDFIGISPPIMNAYRRIMIAEVPSVAIEYVFLSQNTSVMQDEMLSHRLGLLPIKIDPKQLDFPDKDNPHNENQKSTLVFTLDAKCELLDSANPERSARREDLYKNYKVLSGDLKFQPIGKQKNLYDNPKLLHRNIILTKLSAGQEVNLKAHAVKGIGRDHTKFSPVATATYRLMPDIQILEPIEGDLAIKLKNSFSQGVIEITGKDKVAKVVNARIDTGSRNVFRYPDLKDKIKYDLIKEHFIFNIESTGCIPAMDILLESLNILEAKCEHFLKEVRAYSDTFVEEMTEERSSTV